MQTPLKEKKGLCSTIQIPPSPQMKKLGYGTGVAVYEFQRSPISNKFRSPWAVKKLIKRKGIIASKEVNERIQNEAQILRNLNHPNIVGFRAFTKDIDGSNVLAMEECSSSLGDLIENRLDFLGNVPYPANTILKVCYDISKALNYLHNEILLLHCDIKSFNILVKGEFEICKLCDFGVCLPLTKLGELDLNKTNGEVEYTGTPIWCPPEVLKTDQEITTKADIYSLGLVSWEMLSLSIPVEDDNIKDKTLPIDQSFTDSSQTEEYLEDSFKIEVKSDRRRPDLPDIELGSEYNLVLEMYFCCTAVDKDKRPTAKDLVNLLSQTLKKN